MRNARSVKDVMSPDVMTVPDEMTTDELARYLTEREISGAPVVDGQGHLVGVVSMTDIGRALAEPNDFDESPSPEFYRDAGGPRFDDLSERGRDAPAMTVRDVMTPVVHQVASSATVGDAANVMIREHIHRLVVTQNRQPVGIVTSLDLLRALVEATAR